MSTFGSGGFGFVVIVACLVCVPEFGWGPVIAATLFTVGWGIVLHGANAMFHADGTRKRPSKHSRANHGRTGKRGARRPGDVASH